MAARQIIVAGAMPSRNNNGRAMPAQLYFYVPDAAFSTPKSVYTDNSLETAHDFPVESDSSGRFPQIWAEEGEFFDVVWKETATGRQHGAFENVQPLADALLASATQADAAADAAEVSATEAAQSATDLAASVAAAEAAADIAVAAAADAVEIAGFDPTNYALRARSIIGGGLATGGGDLNADRTITVTAAPVMDVRFGNNKTKALTVGDTYDAMAEVALTDAATIAVDMGGFINAVVTLGGNRTLGNPTNTVNGKTGRIRVVQDATGSRTLAFASNWKRAGGAPVASTTPGAQDFIDYDVVSPTYVRYAYSKDPS